MPPSLTGIENSIYSPAMQIHEYQGKDLLKKYGVPVPEGLLARTIADVEQAVRVLGLPVVIKAQIHAGGRGQGSIMAAAHPSRLVLAGGVQLVKKAAEATDIAAKMLGNILVTQQTGPEGRGVGQLLIEKACDIAKEFYLGLTLDRVTGRVTIMASREGGMEIEEVAARSPEKILRAAIDPALGFQAYQGRCLGFDLGLQAAQVARFTQFVAVLAQAYASSDASLLEINPLVLMATGDFLALDAKVNFDDNALFRHQEYEGWRDVHEEDAAEIEARKSDLSYVSMNGNIGCMVNGAGLAMATMDIIKLYGGQPANFLDVGGGASAEKVTSALQIILKDPKVRAILVNIFGGIMKCDVIAEGIVAAAKSMAIKVPLVVRLQGTRVAEGRKILHVSGLQIIPAETMSDAAQKVVEAAR